MQRPSRGQEGQNAQSAWTTTSKELDRELRKHVLAEMRQSQAVEASVLAARKILPMTYLFERDIQECRDRMRRAVVDVLKRMQTQAKALAWRRWKRHLHLLELEETRNKAEMDLLIKQAKSLRTLERLARRALQGKPRIYLMHWKSQTNAMIDAERRSAAGTIQRCYRGHVGRRKAARRSKALERMRQRNSDAVCATAFLERRATLVRMYNAKRRARAAQCEAAAMRIQLLFRRYCAQRHVAFLANRKAGDLRLQQAAIKMQSAWRERLALRAAHNVRDARRAVNIALGRKIAMRNRAALAISRVGRGAIGRQEARARRLEWEYLSRAAERIQKFYRVKNGSYALSRVWRAHRGRKRFKQLLKLEKGRVIQEEYKHERKLKMEKDKERLARKEARQNRRREALGRFREEAYLTAVKSRTKLRETEGFQIPGWAENLCSLDLLERVLKHEKRRHEIDRAWTEVPVDETQPESDCYFYNELTGHSQWEVPDCIAQERAREARDAERSEKAAALVQAFEAKRTARPAETLLCRRNVPWVSALAMCNRPATIHCHHCNENQLANRRCTPCGDDFCDNCWKLTHRTAAREKHVFEAYSRFTRPELEYGDRWCPYCDLAPAARNCKHCGDIYCVECYEEFHENGRRRTHVWTPANDYAVWKKLYDVASSRYYYFNTFTEESTWEKPAAILQREEDEDAGRPVTEGLRRVQEREATENEDSDNPIPGQIRVLEEEVAHLQEWKAEMDRQNEEDDAAEAEEAIRSFRSGAKAKKAQVFSFLRQKRTLEEEVFYEQKAYLERMLRDEATKDIGIDAALTGTELSRNAYEAKLLQDMAEARVAIRKDAHRQAVEQMSNDLFKKRVAKATKEFRGVSNSHQLVLECKKAGIKYGPDYLGAGKMTKTEAIEKLVIWRYEQEIEQKHRLEDQANLLKDTEKIRKRLARLEAGPGERAKGPASRFGGLFSRFPKA
ncbi:Pre-mRNA-processing protein PRP40 [Hondaea fermentalgiana]|uniref:Pre-mRNA-processing protein PRP40 n=1 Tax=Hondaea fermentalgiana TaxID=2315210 RepID=A0A2R5GUB7_9STRA|nr:Pre-mRNA-processing protein PRP40 [Hondaea fermentalgiana]|eukprot:GBG34155.1 Pre-mRNA-processing protein PRP40 [Hondaea fermentalgiana]